MTVKAKNLTLAVSALALFAYLAAMNATFGQRHWTPSTPPSSYQIPNLDKIHGLDRAMPVYQIHARHGVRLVGRGLGIGTRDLKIEIYPDLEDAEHTDNAVIWMPGDFRSIRALMPPSMPAELRSIMRQFTGGLEKKLHEISQTPRFQATYRPELEKIVTEAIGTSWKAPATRTALSHASTAISQEISTKFIEEAMPVLLEYQQAAFAEIVDAGRRDLIGRLLNWQETLAPLRATLGQTFRDPRVQSALAAELEAVMTVPETIEFANVFGIGVARRLAQDPRWPQLLDRVINDDALAKHVDVIEDLTANAGKQMLLRLVSQEADRETNVLALEVLRDVLLDRSRSFFLLVPWQRRDIIDRADGETWFLLNKNQIQ
jgi:hypothetical protein